MDCDAAGEEEADRFGISAGHSDDLHRRNPNFDPVFDLSIEGGAEAVREIVVHDVGVDLFTFFREGGARLLDAVRLDDRVAGASAEHCEDIADIRLVFQNENFHVSPCSLKQATISLYEMTHKISIK